MAKLNLIGISIALVVTSSTGCTQVQAETCNAHCEFIELLIAQIKGGSDENMRGDMGEDLGQYLRNFPKCGSDASIVKDIASLLTDGNDAVMIGAAEALGNIGPPAKIAVPALEQALRVAQEKIDKIDSPLLPSVSLTGTIRGALEHINGSPGEPKAKND